MNTKTRPHCIKSEKAEINERVTHGTVIYFMLIMIRKLKQMWILELKLRNSYWYFKVIFFMNGVTAVQKQ